MNFFKRKPAAPAPIQLDAIVARPGDLVILRTPTALKPEVRSSLLQHLRERTAATGVRFTVFEAVPWEACVTGAPE